MMYSLGRFLILFEDADFLPGGLKPSAGSQLPGVSLSLAYSHPAPDSQAWETPGPLLNLTDSITAPGLGGDTN